ncbi:undecaprenyldiphospho-muramoylpentapeptide beta-N-acetylglucosaminyltransferase [Paenibacillus sp. 1001270B_150601_E10]|uniref:undecaprenyldiphospho-muramoylpentapeptide beta-N-acetylglucosaminyltransferase n=1 Tax=Paenibacillus sp. 1001270B_150601_E10 TaxID=2787079 RepID=UPI0018A121C0|nr:undecaprenyldiphospho-muramoylpentapeptide beta-N-acetylglucosaminyltransferase [Paenibacillus sp. 1001270B_150601_E10]
MTKRILLTGGGSTGHVAVNLALIPVLLREGWEVHYMGSHDGIESKLMKDLKQVQYVGISTGKLRRYWSWTNVTDPFRVLKGVAEAYRNIRRLKPRVVFSKGGFVSVPVVIAAWMNRVPVIVHESDLTPGLANRIVLPYVNRICTTFEETKQHLRHPDKVMHLGAIVREELLQGRAERGYQYCHLRNDKPVIVVMGGSLGAKAINKAVREAMPELTRHYQIVHLCGAGQLEPNIQHPSYRQYEYLTDPLPDVLAMADMVISRAGSNSIFELLTLHKPMLLIPLSKAASRGDQLLNAESFAKHGYGEVLLEENLTRESLLQAVERLYMNHHEIRGIMKEAKMDSRMNELVKLLKSVALT